MKNVERLQAIKNGYSGDMNTLIALKGILVDKGLISQADLANIMSLDTKMDLCEPTQLALVYQALYTIEGDKLDEPQEFFTQAELDAAHMMESTSPIKGEECVFNDCYKISPNNEFGCFITLGQIYELSQSRQVKILSDIQRETEVIKAGISEIPCVHFMPDKMNSISRNWLEGKQHPNTIRFHVLPEIGEYAEDCFEYDDDTRVLTIKKGIIANIDGNHRMNAIVDAVSKNRLIGKQYKMGLIVSFGNSSIAREIITQEEERTPIEKEHINSLKATLGNEIVMHVAEDSRYPKTLKVCATPNEFRGGIGKVVKTAFAEAITDSFKLQKNMNPLAQMELERYLVAFMAQYAYYLEKKEPDYLSKLNLHTEYIMSNECMIYGLMDAAAAFRKDSDWDTDLALLVDELDFYKKTTAKKYSSLKLYSKKLVGNAAKEIVGENNE